MSNKGPFLSLLVALGLCGRRGCAACLRLNIANTQGEEQYCEVGSKPSYVFLCHC